MSEPVGTAAVDAPLTVEPEAARERGPGPVAIALLAIGFGFAAAAQYLPWSTLDTNGLVGAGPEDGGDVLAPNRRTLEITLIDLNTGHVTAYLGTVVLVLVAIAVLLATRGTVRRAATAAAIGLLAGNALVLVGFQSALKALGSNPYTAYSLPEDSVEVGLGYPFAAAATVLLAAGAIVAVTGVLRLGSRAPKAEHFDGPEPLELTVTPVAPR